MKYKLRIATILLIGIALRVFGLTIHSLWFDELCTVDISSTGSLRDIFLRFFTSEGGSERYQPLNIVLMWGWRQLIPTTDISLRLFPAILSIASLPLMYRLAGKCVGKSGAVWSLAFYACSSYGVYYAQEVRPYALLILLVMGALHSLVCSLQRDTWIRHLCLGIICGLALWGSIFSALFISCLGLADIIVHRHAWKRVIARWVPSVLICSVVLVSYLWYKDVASGTHGSGVPDLQQALWKNASFSLFGVMVGTTYGPSIESLRSGAWAGIRDHLSSLVILGLICVGLGFTGMQVWKRMAHVSIISLKRRPVLMIMASGALMLCAMAIFSITMNFNWQPRHTYWMLPIIALFVGRLAQGGGLARFIIGGLITLNLYSISQYWFNVDHRKDDIRGASMFLSSCLEPAINLGTPNLRSMYAHYGAQNMEQHRGAPSDLIMELEAIGAPDVWAVIYRPFYSYWINRQIMMETLKSKWIVTESREFKNIMIYRITRKQPSKSSE